jgi:ubiquinone biosynthesis protein COQ9
VIIDSFENKQKILDNFLKIVAFEDWSKETLILATKNANIDEKLLPIIFENDIFSLIEFITQTRCNQVKKIAENDQDFNTKKTHEKISYLIFNLLNLDKNNKIAFKRLINFYLDPKNLLPSKNCSESLGLKPLNQSFKELYYVSDFLWNICLDKSTDFNFYSKRITLTKVLIRSFLFYVNDDSENSIKTQNFINSQINNIINFAKIKNSGKKKINDIKNLLNENLINKNLDITNPINFLRNLPFIRLVKTNIFK